MGGIIGALIVFGALLVVVPIAGAVMDWGLSGFVSVLLVTFGGACMLLGTILAVVTKLYVKTKADEAFVRTGMGGMKIVKDGGALVVPVVHQQVTVPLRTFRLEVTRKGADALLTADKLRADIKAEFFVRIQPNDADITNAARSLGDRTEHEATIRGLIEDKLVSALRTVAETKTLEALNSQRDEFVKQVADSVTSDLKHNGFTLETATISALDQADASTLKTDNVFDAEGLLTITKITEQKRTERNAIQRERERERLSQDVEAKQKMLALDQARAKAEAEQQSAIAVMQAEQVRAAQEAKIEADQRVQQAQLRQQQTIEVEKQRVEQATLLAEQEKQQAAEVAAQHRQQAAEVAERDRGIAVARKEQEQAEAQTQRLAAEKARETEAQGVETVKVVQEAERAKQQQVIGAQATAETQYVTAQRAADAEAYKLKALADGKKAAAGADAEAIQKKAEADSGAAKLRAEGERAVALVPIEVKAKQVEVDRASAMIPVDVAAKQVEIDRDRVEQVLKPELAARAKDGQSAQEFELAKFEIEVRGSVQVEVAKAFAQFGHKIDAQVFGTPEDVARMANGLFAGMAGEKFAQGLLGGNRNGNGHAHDAIHGLVGAVGAIGSKLGLDLGSFLSEKLAAPKSEAAPALPAPALAAPESSYAAPARKPMRPRPAAEPAPAPEVTPPAPQAE